MKLFVTQLVDGRPKGFVLEGVTKIVVADAEDNALVAADEPIADAAVRLATYKNSADLADMLHEIHPQALATVPKVLQIRAGT